MKQQKKPETKEKLCFSEPLENQKFSKTKEKLYK